jgi:hypothetical protein
MDRGSMSFQQSPQAQQIHPSMQGQSRGGYSPATAMQLGMQPSQDRAFGMAPQPQPPATYAPFTGGGGGGGDSGAHAIGSAGQPQQQQEHPPPAGGGPGLSAAPFGSPSSGDFTHGVGSVFNLGSPMPMPNTDLSSNGAPASSTGMTPIFAPK